jgi:hypothetical protein
MDFDLLALMMKKMTLLLIELRNFFDMHRISVCVAQSQLTANASKYLKHHNPCLHSRIGPATMR